MRTWKQRSATGAPGHHRVLPVPADPAAHGPGASDAQATSLPAYLSFEWARATSPDGATAEAWLQTGESYAFTAAASIRAVEETLARSLGSQRHASATPGVTSPANRDPVWCDLGVADRRLCRFRPTPRGRGA